MGSPLWNSRTSCRCESATRDMEIVESPTRTLILPPNTGTERTPLCYPTMTPDNSITRLRLSLTGPMPTPGGVQDLIDFLWALRELRYLWLSFMYVLDGFFQPNECLVGRCTASRAYLDSKQVGILEFVRSRWTTGSLLKVTLGETQPAVAEQWQALCDEEIPMALSSKVAPWLEPRSLRRGSTDDKIGFTNAYSEKILACLTRADITGHFWGSWSTADITFP
ncbi:uncharacterized protein BT62DRAFT_1010053 [Guyanagaster necrorhizus]|uniref:Uncharacterized protein n=1 Tax=Guyanagaster necrorhizus TaxID=856835 RepID=A0A9P7VLL0_9AGAR|nr:uncharacterized protein BT62DRAFT_1010053 [Guyanagaster necrorhizus MCA 3950]KAG7442722.1 hypothetical protein BT62DRAFT_1010053 [Guyanagaster necrorhizus MCA 3950]